MLVHVSGCDATYQVGSPVFDGFDQSQAAQAAGDSDDCVPCEITNNMCVQETDGKRRELEHENTG